MHANGAIDVLVITALREEYEQVLEVTPGAFLGKQLAHASMIMGARSCGPFVCFRARPFGALGCSIAPAGFVGIPP
jgi:hypothetical protein